MRKSQSGVAKVGGRGSAPDLRRFASRVVVGDVLPERKREQKRFLGDIDLPDPFHALAFPSALDAKRAIADHLGMPLAKLSPDQLSALNALLADTLAKPVVWDHVRCHLDPVYRG